MKIDKERLIEQLKISEQFNASLPKWVWGVIEGMKAETREETRTMGKWLKRKIHEAQQIQNGYELHYCSECDKNFFDISGFSYCPNCGAKMEGAEE